VAVWRYAVGDSRRRRTRARSTRRSSSGYQLSLRRGRWGNTFAATPSDGGGRLADHPRPRGHRLRAAACSRGSIRRTPSAIAPGKRPRLTPNPGLIMRDGRVFAPYGTPGLDVQPQAIVQLVVNMIDFGMERRRRFEHARGELQLPRLDPPAPVPTRLVRAEPYPRRNVGRARATRPRVERWPYWAAQAGALCTVVADPGRGFLTARPIAPDGVRDWVCRGQGYRSL
jgi:gamma-glutamyltranspeptidase/glutathione hydrolase